MFKMFISSVLGSIFFKRFLLDSKISYQLLNFIESILLRNKAILLIIPIVFSVLLIKGSFSLNLSPKKILNIILFFIFLSSGISFLISYSSSQYIEDQKINEDFSVIKENRKHNSYIIKSVTKNEKVILNIYSYKDRKLSIEEGDIVRIKGKIKKPETNRNPMLFNYRDYLHSNYIFSIININEKDILHHEKSNLSIRVRFYKYMESSIDTILNKENSDFMKSVLLGNTDYMDKDRVAKVRELGIAHLLAVSGFHIGIVYLFSMKSLNIFVRLHKRKSQLVSLSIIFIYIYMIGFPISAMRAFLMISILVVSQILHKRMDPLNILGAVGFFILLARPLFIMSLSFKLSFLGVISVIILSPKISFSEVFSNMLDNYGLNSIVAEVIKVFIRKTQLNTIIASFVGLFPISIYYFNKYSLTNIISNLLISFIFTFSVILTIMNIILLTISKNIGIFISFISDFVNSVMNDIITHLDTDIMYFKSPNIIEFLIIYLAIFILFRIININDFPKQFIKFVFISMIIASAILPLVHNDNNAYIRFVDVGQGDAAWIEYGDKNYIIDFGDSKFNAGEMILKPLLLKNGVKKIDGAIVSHFDSDHAGGLTALLDTFQIDRMYIGHRPEENELYREVVKKAEYNKTEVILVNDKRDTIVDLSGNGYIRLISPSEKLIKGKNENDSSLISLLNINGRTVLFTGDIEKEGEEELIGKMNADNSMFRFNHKSELINGVDILKVPHHGSKTSSSEELLGILKPKFAVIQCGKNNFGHPDEDVLERYRRVNARIFRNDKDGWIEFTVDVEGNLNWDRFLKPETGLKQLLLKNREQIVIVIIYIMISMLMVSSMRDVYRLSEVQKISDWMRYKV